MSRIRHAAIACAAFLSVAVAPAASAAETPPATPPAATPAPAPVSAPVPVAGRIQLVLQKVGGTPPFAMVGGRIVVRGIVNPYVAGQSVSVSFYREGRKVAVNVLGVRPVGNGAGQFHVNFSSHYAGLVQARAAHYATAQQGAFSGHSPAVRFVNTNLGPGARGQSVRLLQSELDVLHYAVPLSGVFDEGTGQALVAYRKMTGLERIAYAGRQVLSASPEALGASMCATAATGATSRAI